ncbi:MULTISPECIES: hypothetical protein [unclassified Arsukibacterium]|uniref:hypothetical protein n=1 Tax=unclassified Arsukibacterium TaxID=2635278 RepID=UPI000C3B8F65|nr:MULTISPECIES: hypothetical protein [unclassified Arsukibacterium]MAA94244.1 hypothetical protein [Rheinheimera sp.]MBM35106.1 hypothetical protein [Rheinheimera sp.]HAW93477.1 hypothetical protein [Candidatus Azambacteria bacterium]|tara:strand:- start:149 stop:556 length:408 start_codon:yes stop_codon:yes gene_type:complete
MQSVDITKLMQDAARDAVAYIAEEHKLTLDFTLASLKDIDTVLATLHQHQQQQSHSAELIFTLSNIIGAYVGEVFIANYGGNWHNNTADNAAPYISVQLSDREFPFASVCYHKITQDNSILVANYVKQAAANVMQ